MTEDRRLAALPFAVLGVACVIAGGLVAAATAPNPSEHGSWAAAYLVLVAGVAQVGLGVGQAALAVRVPSAASRTAEFAAWNCGNALVIAGTLAGVTALVDLGGALLVAALALLVRGVRGARPTRVAADAPTERAAGGSNQPHRWPLFAFRALVLVLLVSIPIGLVLARTAAG